MTSDPIGSVVLALFGHKGLHALIMGLDIGSQVARLAHAAVVASDSERHSATVDDGVVIGALVRIIDLLLHWFGASIAAALAGAGASHGVGTGECGCVESWWSVVDALVADTPLLIEVDAAAGRSGRAQFHAFFQRRKHILGEDLCSMALLAVHTECLYVL